MTKPFRLDDLSDQFESDMAWRIKELSDLKAAIKRSDETGRAVLLRSLIAIMYAHWEGYVKLCATKYFEHLTLKKLPFDQLEPQLYHNAFLARLDALSRNKTGLEEKCKLLEEILGSKNRRFAAVSDKLVDTGSNLKSAVLRDLCRICGIAFDGFIAYEDFIDRQLLGRRNKVAHGEELYLKVDEVDDLIEKAIGIMRLFRNLLENKAYAGLYRAA